MPDSPGHAGRGNRAAGLLVDCLESVVAFQSEGALAPEDNGFPVDVFVHDQQPS